MSHNGNPASKWSQPVSDPLAYFKAIPWCDAHITHKSVVNISIPDRTPIPSTESALVRETLNTPDTVKACATFLRYMKPTQPASETGEDKNNPFLEVCALVEIGKGFNGFAQTVHGGAFGVILDEVMGTAANMQAAKGALTASLTVRFKAPLYTPQVVLVRGKVAKKDGKKLFLKGSFEDKNGKILAEADGVWIMVQREVGRWTDGGPTKPQAKL